MRSVCPDPPPHFHLSVESDNLNPDLAPSSVSLETTVPRSGSGIIFLLRSGEEMVVRCAGCERCEINVMVFARRRDKRYGYTGSSVSRTFDKNLSNLSPIYKSK